MNHRARSLLAACGMSALSLAASPATARVIGFEVAAGWRPVFDGAAFGEAGVYERLDARATFALDPDSPRASALVDVDQAPVDEAGEVRFSTEVVILRPVDPGGQSDVLFYEVPNRGRNLSFMLLNRSAGTGMPEAASDAGDGFLMEQGYTLVWSGWQADLADDDLLQLDLPRLEGVTGTSREEFIFDDREPVSRGTLTYPAADLDPAKATLTVRARESDPRASAPGMSFRYVGPTEIEITRPRDLPAGAIYEFIYPARDPVPAGLAFVALSDLISFLRGSAGHDAEPPLTGIEHTIGIGISQSGRFLRDFIYHGFNADAGGAQVFDGAMPHIAGSRKTFTNYRFAQPGRYSRHHEDHDFPGDQFPFTYASTTDPLTGRTDSILAACRATETCPKIIHTDSATEFYQGRASLLSTAPDGSPVEMPDDVRLYFLAGVQHFTAWAAGSQPQETCLFDSNPAHPAPVMRALVKAMEAWVTAEKAPPPSRFPSVDDGTLVELAELKLPRFADVDYRPALNRLVVMDHASVPPGRGAAYRVLVPAVDADGIAEGGVEVPSVGVPLGTHFGWNLRKEGFGEGELCSLTGSFVPFPKAPVSGDSRAPLDERYASRDAYLAAVEAAAEKLVIEGLMLEADIPMVVGQARDRAAVLD